MDLRLIPFPSADYGLPDGCENLTSLPISLVSNFFNAIFALRTSLDDLLHNLRPDCLVSDALFSWTTAVARDHGIPRLIFQVTGLLALCAPYDLTLHRPYESVTGRSHPFSIPDFPHPIKLTGAVLPEVFDFPFMLGLLREAELTSYGVVINSFYALEPDYAEHYYKMAPRKVFLLGPLAIAGRAAEKESSGETGQRDPCLSWLESKEDKSVVYVSFGTLCRFSDEQLRELALGLEWSGHPFIWAVRVDGRGWMPEGFERRVAGRGMVVGWAPQVEILNHRAVGGYVIHCGWNSVLEGVNAGLPMTTWPLHSEQFLIEKLIVDVLRIGMTMWDGMKSVVDEEKVVVPADEVAKGVKRLMGGGDEVEAMRRRVKELREMGRKAIADGGSSYNDMNRLIKGLMECRGKQRKDRATTV